MFGNCDDELEQLKWCFQAKLNSPDAIKRLKQRRRETYHNIDKLPWSYKKEYLEYLKSEDRLPKRMEEKL